jgi:hypothetical protein
MNMVFILREDRMKAIERIKNNPFGEEEADYNQDGFFKDSYVFEEFTF